MKKLNELFDCDYDIEIKGIKINSMEIEKGDLFICTMGVNKDRHEYIPDAIEKGCAAIVVSKDVDYDIPTIKVEDTNKIVPIICSKFYDNPEKELKLIGVTGTDGKTSTSTIIETLIGDDCAYIGTNGRRCKNLDKDTNNTTPDSDKLYLYFREFLDHDAKVVAMEASSEAFFRERLTNLSFDISVITNITREHLNIHKTFENYIDCKCQLFRQTKKDGYAIINFDDPSFDKVKEACNCNVLTYGKNESCTLQIKNIKVYPNKTTFTFKYLDKEYDVLSPLLGEFNVYNLSAGILACIAYGVSIETILERIKYIKVSGRLELLPNKGQNFSIMIDYAHTPNGISNLLNFVHTLDINRSIVVIGSAGERDFLKRPIMGKTVTDNASYAIFTYEDPRSEDPKDIINMLTSEIEDKSKYEIVVDRSLAIKKAIDIAEENDMVLILGKGNETYEKLKDRTIYFNDFEEAEKHLKERLEMEKVTN